MLKRFGVFAGLALVLALSLTACTTPTQHPLIDSSAAFAIKAAPPAGLVVLAVASSVEDVVGSAHDVCNPAQVDIQVLPRPGKLVPVPCPL